MLNCQFFFLMFFGVGEKFGLIIQGAKIRKLFALLLLLFVFGYRLIIKVF